MPASSSATSPAFASPRLARPCRRRSVPSCRSVAATTSARIDGHARRRPPASGGARPPRPSASRRGWPCRRCAGAASRAAGPSFASTTGQQRQRDERRDERDQHPAVAHRAQERQRQRDQREQADRDRDAAEQHRAAGGLHRALHGLVARAAVRALLAPARDDDQRVVDRHAEADQRDQELHDRRDGRQLGQPEQQQERGQDRDDRHQQRHDREERGEDERQHDERAEAAEHRLERARRGPRSRRRCPPRARRSPVRWHAARRRRVASRSAALAAFSAGGVLAEGRVRVGSRIDERERRAAVVGDEGRVAGRGVGGDPRARQRLARGARRAAAGPPARRGESTVWPSGSVTTGSSGAAFAARAAVALGDLRRSSPSPPCRGPRTPASSAFEAGPAAAMPATVSADPEDDDGALVGEDPTGER